MLTGLEFTHTEFPPHWTVERIAQEIRTACEHGVRSGLLDGKIKKPLYVTTSDNFTLKIITNLEPLNHACESIPNTINRHIVTAHPVFKVK